MYMKLLYISTEIYMMPISLAGDLLDTIGLPIISPIDAGKSLGLSDHKPTKKHQLGNV